MTTNSELESKYTRLCGEFKKLREKQKTLKEAVVKERSKTAEIQDQLRDKDITLRKFSQERESLVFRNDHLTKQIGFLRDELEAERAALKNKSSKRHGNKHSGHAATNSGELADNKSETDTALEVLTEELELKIKECSRLHTQVSEQAEFHTETVETLKKEIAEKSEELQRCMENQQTSELSLQSELLSAKEERVAAEVRLAVQERDMKLLNMKYKQLYNAFENYKQDIRYKRAGTFSDINDSSNIPQDSQNHTVDEEITNILQLEKYSPQEYDMFLSEVVRLSNVMLDCFNQCLQKFKKRLTFFHQSISGADDQKFINEFIANLSSPESFVKELLDKLQNLTFKSGQHSGINANMLKSICEINDKARDYLTQNFLPNLQRLYGIECSRYNMSSTFVTRQSDLIECVQDFIARLDAFNDTCLSKMNFRTPKEFAESFIKKFDSMNSSIREFARLTNNKVSLEQEFLKSFPKEKSMNNELAHSLVNVKAKFDCISTYLSKSIPMLMLHFDLQNKSLHSKPDNLFPSPPHRPESREDTHPTLESSNGGAHFITLNNSLSGASDLRDEVSTGVISCSMSRVSSPSIGGEVAAGITDRRMNALIDRVTFLEKESQELSLKLQISEKRRQKEKSHCTYLETILQSEGVQYDLTNPCTQSTNQISSSIINSQCVNDIDQESDREKLVKQFYTKQLAELSQNLHKMLSRVLLYHDECKILHYRLAIKEAELEKMSGDISNKNYSIKQLKDDLELTQDNYSKQISQMSDHIAALNCEMEEERKQIEFYRSQQNTKRGFLGMKKS